MKCSTIVLVVGLMLVTSMLGLGLSGNVTAQRPGRATPAATLDRSGTGANRTPIATPDAAQPTRQRPNGGNTDGFATREVTFSPPVLNLTLTPRGTLPFPGSLEEAGIVINSFAATYLGSAYEFLYAGVITGDNSTANWDAYVAELPESVQAYIATFASAAGGSYWGVFKTGIGMTAIGDCISNPNCTVSMENVNLYLTSASAGVYAVYVTGAATNSSDALNLIYSAYPSLVAVSLEPATTEEGFAFQAVTYDTGVNNQQVTASTRGYLAGVISSGNQSLVYASVAVGDGYVGMMN